MDAAATPGESRALFGAVVTRHAGALQRFSRALCRTPEAAEDALQQGLMQAWQAFEGPAAPRAASPAQERAWLFTIVRHAAYRQARLRAGQPAHHDVVDDVALAMDAGFADASDPVSLLSAMEDAVLVHRALDRLPDLDREVLALRDLEGVDGASAAAVLGIPEATVKTRLHRARLRLGAEVRRLLSAGEVPHG